ncbi:DoxX family protein [Bacillus sp. FJAT-52991]|uniref:DoxX family protein n=1 Tax=Bacillus kandeliae TaxID=3129297 RepID=A0ABZ2N6X9_9BACI
MTLSIILQVLLALGFLMFGYQKFTSEQMKKGFEYFGYGDSFRIFTGSFEILSAIVLIAGIWVKPLAAIGGFMIVATMIGAILTHMKVKDSVKNMLMPLMLLVLGAIVAALNWSSLF